MRALDGLPGISKVSFNLQTDVFTVAAGPTEPQEHAVFAAISKLGYRPSMVSGEAPLARQPAEPEVDSRALPALVAAAVERASGARQQVVVVFAAQWCAPCKLMHERVWPDSRVVAAMVGYVKLYVDTDSDPDTAKAMGVAGLPDIRILAVDGREVARLSGFQDAKRLVAALQAARQGP